MGTKHTQLPFTGLHVYQRTQEAWTHFRNNGKEDRLRSLLEMEVQRAVLGIARATALSSQNDRRTQELEDSRAAIHAAGAIADQLTRRGTPVEEDLQELLVDAARMLGALIRTLQASGETKCGAQGQNGAGAPVEA